MFGIDDAIGTGLKIVSQVIDRVIPDPAAAAAAKLELMKLEQSGELAQLSAIVELSKAQAATNTIEAGSSSIFVSGWRPFMGWICDCCVLYHFIVERILVGVLSAFHVDVALPTFDTGQLMLLVTGMLGLGAMRTYEKTTGVVTPEPSDGTGTSTQVKG